MQVKIICAIVLTMFLWGCSWRGLVNEDVTLGPEPPLPRPPDHIISKDSWDLEDCFQLALAQSERLAISKEDLTQAKILRDKAIAASLPKLNLRGHYLRYEQVPTWGRITGLSPQQVNESWLSLRYPIFTGFRDIITFRRSVENIAKREEEWHHVRSQLYLDTAKAFYDLLTAQKEVQALKASLQLSQRRYDLVKAREAEGLARRAEVLLAESQVARDQAYVTGAESNLVICRIRLGFFIGVPVDRPLLDKVRLKDPPQDPAQLIEQAIAKRRDLAGLRRSIQIAQDSVAVAKGRHLPAMTLLGNMYGRREGYLEETDWELMLELNWPLFEGGTIAAGVAEANSKLYQAKLAYRGLRRRIQAEVKEAHARYLSAVAQIKAIEKELKAAQAALTAVEKEYEQGMATGLEVFVAQNNLRQARLALEKAGFKRRLALVQLYVATGELPKD
jgi:outer membrane protein TolC